MKSRGMTTYSLLAMLFGIGVGEFAHATSAC